jgi:GNAT superfamily N-acetyltransferase
MEGLDFPAGSSLAAYTAQERPDLWEDARSRFSGVWPEYNLHANDSATYFGSLFPLHAHLQILFFDRATERVVARGRTIPFRWDGSLEDLPTGIDAVGLRAVGDSRSPTALAALAAEVDTDRQREGLSPLLIQAMAEAARQAGLAPLVAPVRPSWKDRYPLIPIDRYAYWKQDDDLPFDPWLRVHARLGATILRPEPKSMRIESPIDEWERWTGLTFPEDGEYVFPFGLSPLLVKDGVGSYWEPNVWMLHEVTTTP